MPAKKKKKTTKLKDLKAKDVSSSKAANVRGGRDPASGLPTGKRMHKPYTATSN